MLAVALAEVDLLARSAGDFGDGVGERFLAHVLGARLLAAGPDDHPGATLGNVELLHFLDVLGRVEHLDLQLVGALAVLAQALVQLGELRLVGRVEGEQAHLALEPPEDAVGLVGERVDLLLGEVPGLRLLHRDVVETGERGDDDHRRPGADHSVEGAAAAELGAHRVEVRRHVGAEGQDAQRELDPDCRMGEAPRDEEPAEQRAQERDGAEEARGLSLLLDGHGVQLQRCASIARCVANSPSAQIERK